MNLGTKQGGAEVAIPRQTSKQEVHYPTVTIEKPVGNYKPGDTFSATVKFRVKSVQLGKEYDNQPSAHRCVLEVLSMDRAKSSKKGLPY